MSNAGFFITVEGIEGAGKSTVCNHLEEKITSKLGEGMVLRVREPGGTEIAEELRSILINDQYVEPMHRMSELLLMVAARNQLLENKIKPALAKGQWVIGDRHSLSSYAYQGIGRGIGIEKVRALHQLCFDDFKPDLILYLDVSAEVGFSRIKSRGNKDRIEQESLSFFRDIRNGYLELIDQVDAVKINAEASLQQIYEKLDEQLQHLFVKNMSLDNVG